MSECHSTNDIAAELSKANQITEGTLVITDTQTRGRGQRGNAWQSSKGENLTFSIVLNPKFLAAKDHFQLHYVVSVAVCNTLLKYFRNVQIKWPNDILVSRKKICGILIENSIRGQVIENAIIGIGLNVNQAGFNYDNATSFRDLTSREYDKQEILGNLLEEIEAAYLKLKSGNIGYLRRYYLKHLFQKDESALYETSGDQFVGTIEGVDDHGRLVMSTTQGHRHFEFKEVKFLY